MVKIDFEWVLRPVLFQMWKLSCLYTFTHQSHGSEPFYWSPCQSFSFHRGKKTISTRENENKRPLHPQTQDLTSLWSALAAVRFLPEWLQKKSFTLRVMNAVWHSLVYILLVFSFRLTITFYFFLDPPVIFHWTNYLSCFWTGSESQ